MLANSLLAGRQREADPYDGRSQQERPRDLSVAVSRCELCVRPSASSRVAGHRAVRLRRGACRCLRAVAAVAERTVHEKTRARRRRRAMWRRARRGSFWLGQSSSDDRRRRRALRGAVRRHVQSAVEKPFPRTVPGLCFAGRRARRRRRGGLQLADRCGSRRHRRRDASGAVDGPRFVDRARRRRDRRLVQLLHRTRAFRRIARICRDGNDFGHTRECRRRRDSRPRAARPAPAARRGRSNCRVQCAGVRAASVGGASRRNRRRKPARRRRRGGNCCLIIFI
mmetsp:Transcript_20177/g.52456  ORF Transcript_20177/g.52456 Transcript_20177/m.52456 type:complete len:282 (-) Transcript_20177:9-854(-)